MTGDGFYRRSVLASGVIGFTAGLAGCSDAFGQSDGTPSATFGFQYDSGNRAVSVTHTGGDEIPAGDLRVGTTDAGRVAWSELGSTTERTGDPVAEESTARLGPTVVNWERPVETNETVRVLYVPEAESVTTLDTFSPPTPTPTATPTGSPNGTTAATGSPTETTAPAPEAAGVQFESDFEDGTLDAFRTGTIPDGDDHTEGYHVTTDPSRGEYAVRHRTESRYLEPFEPLSLEPPLTFSMDVYVHGMSGLNVYLQHDPERNLSYEIKARNNFDGRFVEVGKRREKFTDDESTRDTYDRGEGSAFRTDAWDTLRINWAEDGEITAAFDSSDAGASITDSELAGHTFRIVGYHYGGWAAFDNVSVRTGTGATPSPTPSA